jgi:hypothetical protein
MFANTLKTVALATALVVATAGASMAATYAWVDQDANVRKNHLNTAPVINQVWEGQKVKVVDQWNNWYKIQIPGKDGWVKKQVLDFSPGPFPGPFPGYGYGYGGQFCVNGNNASFCISGGY